MLAIEKRLTQRGMARPAHETLAQWLERIVPQLSVEENEALALVVQLYYRHRFGPQPPSAELAERLLNAIRMWLKKFGEEPDRMSS